MQENNSFIEKILNVAEGRNISDIEYQILDFIDKSMYNRKFADIVGCMSLYFQVYGNHMSEDGYTGLISDLDLKYDCYQTKSLSLLCNTIFNI